MNIISMEFFEQVTVRTRIATYSFTSVYVRADNEMLRVYDKPGPVNSPGKLLLALTTKWEVAAT